MLLPGQRAECWSCSRGIRQFAFILVLSFLFLLAAAAAESGPQVQISHTTENLRGVSTVSRNVAWASGAHGTYLRTIDGGRTWSPAQVPGAEALDFRAVVAFSADEAFLMSAGPGEQSRIYHTSDGGNRWQLQFTNSNPKGFFDSMVFWDARHGVVLGDPIPDEAGVLKFELLMTEDGQNWRAVPTAKGRLQPRIRAWRSCPGEWMRTCGSRPAARRGACFTPAIAGRTGWRSILPWCMGRIRREFFRSRSATRCME